MDVFEDVLEYAIKRRCVRSRVSCVFYVLGRGRVMCVLPSVDA